MSNFDPNAILRGAQLTLVGAHRALQNPGLFTSDHYRQAAIAVAAGIAIRIIIAIPVIGVRILLWILSLFMNLDAVSWDNYVVDGLYFLEHSVLQVPFFLMSMMRYVTPTLDRMFMDSLQWVDQTYIQKHKSDNPQTLRAMYYPNLIMYSTHGDTHVKKSYKAAAISFLVRYGRRAGISLAIYALSFLPYVGRFVLPAASFYTFNNAVGLTPAMVIFGSSVFLPKRYIVMFLQSYFSSRSLMRELLEPYFSRVRYSKEQKKQWFRDREGVLFGFGVGFFIFVKIPLVGVLIYGIAEASTAYLITKITEPPPPPSQAEQFKERDVRWKNKHEFLNLPLSMLDAHNVATSEKEHFPAQKVISRQEFS
ncbi:transmembrane protein UsgS [Mytilinidion resinicola]|uniref:Transmembrane protein UsgS n=1 Tax=Mytilinidion resinicola TaxID=574789 RepID=A0A6A6YJ88_9PEZI|nr:transmembrane protein UsgS [Mytilinidion resinicola]KAF2807987.1 transmembrane protein UsgS [Mytilinidion resinicola]